MRQHLFKLQIKSSELRLLSAYLLLQRSEICIYLARRQLPRYLLI